MFCFCCLGPKVVSNTISVESIQVLNKILRRKVIIWDNIHANDYDPKRVFLGPFKGTKISIDRSLLVLYCKSPFLLTPKRPANSS